MKFKDTIEVLNFIYNRLVGTHKENPAVDYMAKLSSIINETRTRYAPNGIVFPFNFCSIDCCNKHTEDISQQKLEI